MGTAVIQNVGPIHYLSIPLPEGGGVVVMRGRQGVGKSTVLRAMERALTGHGQLERRDNTASGKVEAFGVSLSIGRSTRSTGEAEVESLSDRLSLADLVNPGIADPEKADARRIRALAQLSGIRPDISLFAGLLGPSEFSSVVGDVDEQDGDVVQAAGIVKRKIEKAARDAETAASVATGKVQALRERITDPTPPCDNPAALQTALEDAIRDEANVKSKASNASYVLGLADGARKQLAESEANYQGLSVADARKAEEDADKRVERAERELQESKAAQREARSKYREASQHEQTVSDWRRAIEAGASVEEVRESDVAAATERVAMAREAIDLDMKRRQIAAFARDAEKNAKIYERETARAERLRAAARKTDDVLSKIVGRLNSPFRVEASRLVIETDRGWELFADLSDGEKWRVAFDVGVPFLGPRGEVTIPQGAWGELDPVNRREIAGLAVERNILVMTAEATDDDELTAVVYDGK